MSVSRDRGNWSKEACHCIDSQSTAQHRRLATGDDVRVVLHNHVRQCEEAPHGPEEPGHTGRSVGEPRTTLSPDHPYLVLFDRPCTTISRLGTRLDIPARHYASDERERIEERC